MLNWGWAGVDVFFVLSGFLITGILFDSLDEPGYFRNFYIRRTLRIFPLFYSFWLVMLVLTPIIGIAWNRYNVAMAVYLGNFFYVKSLLGGHPNPGLIWCERLLPRGGVSPLDAIPLWSLCVEEQFYLVWPLAVRVVRSRTKLIALCVAIFVVEPLLRGLVWRLWPAVAQHGATYFNTLTRIDTLLVGAAIALWLRGPAVSARGVLRIAYALLIAPLPLLAGAIFILEPRNTSGVPTQSINDHITNTIGLSLIALFAAGLLLLTITEGTWLFRLLRAKFLVEMGRRSYGLYLLHAVPMYVMAVHLLPRLQAHRAAWLFVPIAAAYALGVAWLSFRFIESPFLRLKDRFAPKLGKVNDPQPV